MIVTLIEKVYSFLWGDLVQIPLPGGSTLGISLLIILLIPTGIYFTIRTRFLPIRLFPDMVQALVEKKQDKNSLSSFQTLIVSTATRVGMGNLVGVVAAISAGGAGAVFWMWVTAIIGSSTAFIEATLAQLYKEKDPLYGGYRGGPAYYIHAYVEEKQKKTSKVKYVIPVLAIAAVLLAAVIATPLLSDSKRHSKEINAGRTTDVSNDGLDAAENSNISDRAEDYVDETADSIPETVQNETANRPTQNTTEAIQMNGAGGDSSDVQAEAGHTKSQTDAQENAGCTDLQVPESADMDAWQEMSNIAVTLQITEIVTAEPDTVQKYAAKLLQVSDASGELITGQDIVLQPEEAETFSVGEEVTGTLLRYDSEQQAWILSRQ